MKTSKDRILTTHTGSLPRPKPLIDLVMNRERGEMIDAAAFEAETARAIDDIVAQQLAAGIDVVSDGEMSKPSYTTYIRHRVSGIAPDPRAAEKGRDIMVGRDLLAHPDFARRRNFSDAPFPGCIGPARYKDRSELDRDIANLKSATGKSNPTDVFMTAPSPGILTRFIINLHYPSEDAYVEALADVMKTEYRAIVEAGLVLQIDAPDLASARNNQHRDLTDDQFRRIAERNIAAINAATEGLPADRMRLHICWGNYEGPHTHDLPLLKIIDLAFKARPQAISIEAANPRHDHEWEDLAEIDIPDDKISNSRRDRFDHQLRRASPAGRAAHRPLRWRHRSRTTDRRRRLRLRHRRAERPDGRRQHCLGEIARAERRRRDRQQAPVGLAARMTPRCRVGKGAQSSEHAAIPVVCVRAVPTRSVSPLVTRRRVGTAPLANLCWVSYRAWRLCPPYAFGSRSGCVR